jgi:uncharacterized phage infection (PIP) family protein YhgE
MKRRVYLMKGTSIAASLLVAGCSGTNEDTAGEAETTTSNKTPPGKHLEIAGEAMRKAGEEVEKESDKFRSSDFESGGVDIRTATISEYLDTAETHLEAAEPDATDDLMEKIDLARSWIELVRDFTGFLDFLAEGYTQANSGFTYLQSERYTDAEEQLVTAEDTLSDADERLTVTQSSLAEIDRSEMNELDAVSLTKVEDALHQLDEIVPAIMALTRGMKYFSRGAIDFEEASNAYDSEQYSTAEAKFRDASNDLNTARSVFKEQEDEAPPTMKSSFIDLTCRAGALRDGSQHLARAMAAIQNGNRARANEESTNAEEALDRCGSS